MERRFTFNAVASLYDAARPSYPEALFDDVIAEARLAKEERILEVGSGTGKATEPFARRGFPILAIEPGAQMIEAARRALAAHSNVEFAQSTFEAWEPTGEQFGVVASAQAWHWVDPAISFSKAAKVLKPGGVLAVFGNASTGSTLSYAFKEIYARHLPQLAYVDPATGYLDSGPFAAMFDASGIFGPVIHKAYPWLGRYTAKSYTDYLGTMSHHRVMEPPLREAILADVAKAIEENGGSFEMDFETHLYMAHPK